MFVFKSFVFSFILKEINKAEIICISPKIGKAIIVK
jgi:hypothetical protein